MEFNELVSADRIKKECYLEDESCSASASNINTYNNNESPGMYTNNKIIQINKYDLFIAVIEVKQEGENLRSLLDVKSEVLDIIIDEIKQDDTIKTEASSDEEALNENNCFNYFMNTEITTDDNIKQEDHNNASPPKKKIRHDTGIHK